MLTYRYRQPQYGRGRGGKDKLTLINHHKNTQKRRTPPRPQRSPHQHPHRVSPHLLPLKKQHRDQVERAVDGYHPAEDGEEAGGGDVEAGVDRGVDGFARAEVWAVLGVRGGSEGEGASGGEGGAVT